MSEYDCSSFAELEFYDDDEFGGDGEGDAVSELERERESEREGRREREEEQVRKRERDIKSSYRTRPPPSPSPSTTLLPILHVLITAGTEFDHKPSDMELGAKLRLPGKRRLALGLRPAGRPPLSIPPLLQAAQSLLPCKRDRERVFFDTSSELQTAAPS